MRLFLTSAFCMGFLAVSPWAHGADNCIDLLRTISSYRTLQGKVVEVFHDFRVDPMLAFELLTVSEVLGEDVADKWVLLRNVRNQVGVDVLDSTAKRAIAELFDHGLWESKANPARRTEKFVRITGTGQATVDAVIKRE